MMQPPCRTPGPRSAAPEIVFLDVQMPELDGFDVVHAVGAENMPTVVFATAHDDQQTRARAEPFAPLGWLTKPYTMASLVNVIRAALSKPN